MGVGAVDLAQQVPGQVLDPDHGRDHEEVDYGPYAHQTPRQEPNQAGHPPPQVEAMES